jgi:hypothetical protein
MFNESLRGMPLFHEVILQDPVFVQELSTNTLSQFLIENEGKAMRGGLGCKKAALRNSSKET